MANNLQDSNLTLDPDFTQLQYGQGASSSFTAEQAAAAGGVLLVAQGGTGANTQAGARTNLGAAASGANADISSLSSLTGNVVFSAAGSALKVKEGANAFMGAATMVAGTVTVNNTRVTAASRIFLTPQNASGTAGSVYVSTRTAATSFVITSTDAADTRDVAYLIIEPA